MLPLPCAKFPQILICGFVSECSWFIDLFIIGLHQYHVVLSFFLFFPLHTDLVLVNLTIHEEKIVAPSPSILKVIFQKWGMKKNGV